jgi:hypothetical protein
MLAIRTRQQPLRSDVAGCGFLARCAYDSSQCDFLPVTRTANRTREGRFPAQGRKRQSLPILLRKALIPRNKVLRIVSQMIWLPW